MKVFSELLSEKTLNKIKELLGEELTKQVNEKLGDYRINVGEEKLIPKTVFDADKTKLKEQLEDRDKQLAELKKSNQNNADLVAQIAELEKTNKENKEAHEKAIAEIRQNHALQSAISGAKAKNIKAVEALIDKTTLKYVDDGNGGYKVEGLDSQIEALKKSDVYLFNGKEQGTPNPQIQPPEPNGGSNDKLRGYFGLEPEKKA